MSDSMSIEIGGDVRPDGLAALVTAVAASGAATDWNGTPIDDEAEAGDWLMEVSGDGSTVGLFDSDIRLGALDDLRGVCRTLGLTYVTIRESEEANATTTFWTPGMDAEREVGCDYDGKPTLDAAETLAAVETAVNEGRDAYETLLALVAGITPPTVPPFRIA